MASVVIANGDDDESRYLSCSCDRFVFVGY